MKTIAAGMIALTLLSGLAHAQEAATMDPAVVEEATATSSAGIIVPLLGLLLLIAALSGSSTPAPQPI